MYHRAYGPIWILLIFIIPLQASDITLLHRIRKYDFLTDIDTVIAPSGSVLLSFNAFERAFKIVLQPNNMLVHHAGIVKVHGEDGAIQEHSLIDFAAGRAFYGKVVEEDSRGILKEVGWARIIFHDDDLWMGRLDPDFEGVFTNKYEMYHIKHVDLYKMAKRPDDAPIIPMLERPKHQQHSRLIIYADAQDGHVAATCPNNRFSFLKSADCGVDSDLFATSLQSITLNNNNSSRFDKREIISLAAVSAADEHVCGFDPNIHRKTGTDFSAKLSTRLEERSASGCPTSRQVLGVGAAADCTYTAQYGSPSKALTQILSDFNSASHLYETTFNISLALIEVDIHQTCTPKAGNMTWNQACSDTYTINDRLSDFSQWRGQKSADEAGLWHLLTNCPTGPSVGIAWLSTVCETTSSSQQSNGVTQYVSGTGISSIVPTEWKVVAHEIGHNFGAIHDCTSTSCPCSGSCSCCQCTNCDCQGQYIMHPTDNSVLDAFSSCSQSTICTSYPKLGTCLKAPGFFATVASGICGNGIKEAGEDCDCGAQCTSDNCCDGTTCKFKNNAKCDDLNDNCCNNCQLLSNGTVCRASIGVCDYAEYCNGVNASCPTDLHVADGTSCLLNGLTCASGICTSRDLQCMSNNTYFTTTGACPGHNSDCALWCSSGSSGCLKGAGSFLDGTPCGYGGKCYQGSCTSSSFFYEIISYFKSNLAIGIPVVVVAVILVLGALLGICSCCVKCRRHKKGALDFMPHGMGFPTGSGSSYVNVAQHKGGAFIPSNQRTRQYGSQSPLRDQSIQEATSSASSMRFQSTNLVSSFPSRVQAEPLAAASSMQALPQPPQRVQYVTYNNKYGI